jgi:hypothetical protein
MMEARNFITMLAGACKMSGEIKLLVDSAYEEMKPNKFSHQRC